MSRDIAKIAMFTDIHFGAKANSPIHNQDCLDFIDWFCDRLQSIPDVDAIGFLGDWFENRNALNIATMNYSYQGAKKLNDLGLPVYFIVGNHDLYHRHTREVHSVINFNEFNNFTVVEEPIIEKNKHGDFLMSPFIFHEEYEDLMNYLKVPVWFGHFEFKGFVVTGSDVKMLSGPDPTSFKGPKKIMSGHFHKRQTLKGSNIVYIGNTFPTTFGDANDYDRGMAVYDFKTNDIEYTNWEDGPKYIKTKLSTLLNDPGLPDKAYVKCLVDEKISFEESTSLKPVFIEKYELRDFILEETLELVEALEDTDIDMEELDLDDLMAIDEMVPKLLEQIESEKIDNKKLIAIYEKLCRSQSNSLK